MNTRYKKRVCLSLYSATGLAVLALLAGCGGGGGQSQSGDDPTGSPDTPSSAGACEAINAIEGGGLNKLAGVVASVGSDGVMSVGNVRFATGGAKVYIDGQAAGVASLRPGEVVSVTGTFDVAKQIGCATSIAADAVIVAAISAVDLDAQSLTLLGQQVKMKSGTVLGSSIEPATLASLQPGDIVRLTGLYTGVGAIEATRIDRATGNYAVAGVVTQLNAQDRTFMVNDSITVDYSGAGLIGFATGDPRNGDPVRVTGTELLLGDASPSGSVLLRPSNVWYSDSGTTFTIFPADFTMRRGEHARFVASSGPGSVTWSIVHADGRACTLDACGALDPATGEYIASIYENYTRFLIVATSIEDATDRVTVPLEVLADQRAGQTGPYTVQGEVFASGTGPIAGAFISTYVRTAAWVQFWYDVRSDDLGRFAVTHLPDSRVYLTAVALDPSRTQYLYVQPCAVAVDVSGNTSASIEMIPDPSLDTLDPPVPQSSSGPTLSGTVYETTPNGLQPVAGVGIGIHLDMWDNVIAGTYTNLDGRYFLCGLGPSVEITVFKPGYVERQFVGFDTSQSRTLDVELQRK